MKIFEEPNLGNGWKCPICGTSEKKPVTLIPILGTRKGNISQAEQYHVSCLDFQQLGFNNDLVLLMRFNDRRKQNG